MDAASPGWYPSTEEELVAASAARLLEESHYLDIKRELAPGQSANKEAAKDLASFAIDGGSLIYGVDEAASPPTLAPFPLAGFAERIDNIARTRLSPPLTITTKVVPSAKESSTGYVVVLVPPSGLAPHMTDGRYYGRGDKTKFVLSDEQVTALHRDRIARAGAVIDDVRSLLEAGPTVGDAMMLVIGRPVGAHSPLLLPMTQSSDWQGDALLFAMPFTHPTDGVYSPSPAHATTVERRPDGLALTSNLAPGRTVPAEQRDRIRAVELHFAESGEVRLLSGRAVDTDKSSDRLIFEKLIVGNTRVVVNVARGIGERSGYLGPWEFGLIVTGLHGGVSWEASQSDGWSNPQPYTANEFMGSATATSKEMEVSPDTVVGRIVGPLLRALNSDRMPLFRSLLP